MASLRARRFLLLPFRNVTRAPAEEWLVSGAPLMLAAALGQFRDLAVVPEERLTAAMRRASLPLDVAPDAQQLKVIANETGGWTAVSGTVLVSGGKIHIGVQALDVATTHVLTRLQGDIPVNADVRLAFDTLAARLLTITGVAATNAVDIGALTTNSVDAYREYVTGVDALRRAEGRAAIDAFKRAVTIDSSFALAWARLGLALAVWDMRTAVDPRGAAYAALDHATSLGGRLPPREERMVRALQAAFRGRTVIAQSIIDSAIAVDSSELELREYRGVLELRDRLLLDTLARNPRLRGSWNHAAALLKDVIERDPGRGSAYNWLAIIYGVPSGASQLGAPFFPALKREATSLADFINPSVYRTLAAVMPDSIHFMTDADWYGLPAAERKRLQRTALDTMRTWSDRWLSSSPNNSTAHLIVASTAEMSGDHERALRELDHVDLAKVTSTPFDVAFVRTRVLLGAGRLADAARLADSVRYTPGVAPQAFFLLSKPRLALHMLGGAWAAAGALSDSMLARSGVLAPRCAFLPQVLATDIQWPLPGSVRVAIMDTIVAHFPELDAWPDYGACAVPLASALAPDSVGLRRTGAAARALQQFDAASTIPGMAGDAALIRSASLARALDSAVTPRLRANTRYTQLARMYSMSQRFEPSAVLVSGDSVSVGFKWIGPAPANWDMPGSFVGWTLRARVMVRDAGDSATVLFFADHPYTRRDSPAAGGVAEIGAALQRPVAMLSKPLSGMRAFQWIADLRVERDAIRFVVRGELAELIKRSHPETAQFGLIPCGTGVTGGLCSWPTAPVEYR